MKIVHITSSLRNGGAEAILHSLVVCNAANKHIVIVLGGTDHYADILTQAGIELHLLDMKGSSNPLTPLWQLSKLLRAEKPDIVQTWMYHANLLGGLIARMSGIKNVVWGIHMSNPKLAGLKKSTQLVNTLSAMTSHFVPAKIVSCGHRAGENHVNGGYSKSRMMTICNGYDLTRFVRDDAARQSLRKSWGIEEGTAVFGNLARWHPVKDHKTMIEALGKLSADKPWKLALAGPEMNEHNEELMQLLSTNAVAEHCILLDQISDVSGYMNALDVHILSSSDEGFPNVLAEAMACGTPCVTTDCGDAGYLVGDTGWVCPIRDPDALSGKLTEALSELDDKPVWSRRTHAASARIADNFSVEHMSAQYQAVWDELQPESS